MEFKLNINMNNAAFDPEPLSEIENILVNVITKLRNEVTLRMLRDVKAMLRDTNGNTVGKFEITED